MAIEVLLVVSLRVLYWSGTMVSRIDIEKIACRAMLKRKAYNMQEETIATH